MSRQATGQTIFYGWFVVAACFAVTATMGETFYSFGVFFKPLENEFGWNRTLTSSAYAAFIIGYSASAIVAGRLADRFKPRFILLCSGLLAGLGVSLGSQVHDINQLRLFLFMAGLGSGATWSVPIASVQRWFYNRPHAGIALALVSSGTGIGGLIFAPLINYLILTQGWRNAFLIVGIIFLAIIVIASLIIKPSPPETFGMVLKRKEEDVPKIIASSWTTRKALASPGFVALLFISSFGSIAFQTVSVHLVPHATDLGMSATAAAAALGLLGGFSVPGRMISGFISDRIGWQRVIVISFFATSLSIIWLLFLQATWMLYGVVFVFGLFFGARAVAQAGIVGEFFGMHSIAELVGIFGAVGMLVSAAAPYVAGYIFDTTGSYSIAFVIVIALLLTGGTVALRMKKPAVTPK